MDLPSGPVHDPQQPRLHLRRVGLPRGPAGEPVPADGLLRGPAQDAGGFGVPVRDDPVAVEGAQTRLHTVEEGGEQLLVPVTERRRIE